MKHGKLGMLMMMMMAIFHQFTIPTFQGSSKPKTLNLDRAFLFVRFYSVSCSLWRLFSGLYPSLHYCSPTAFTARLCFPCDTRHSTLATSIVHRFQPETGHPKPSQAAPSRGATFQHRATVSLHRAKHLINAPLTATRNTDRK